MVYKIIIIIISLHHHKLITIIVLKIYVLNYLKKSSKRNHHKSGRDSNLIQCGFIGLFSEMNTLYICLSFFVDKLKIKFNDINLIMTLIS